MVKRARIIKLLLLLMVGVNVEAPVGSGFFPSGNGLLLALQAYWKCDDATSANFADATGNGRTLTMGGNSSSVSGKLGTARFFNGGELGSIASAAWNTLAATDAMTFVCWFRMDGGGPPIPAQPDMTLMSKGTATVPIPFHAYELRVKYKAGPPVAYAIQAAFGGTFIEVIPSPPLTSATLWFFVAVRYLNGQASISYSDGSTLLTHGTLTATGNPSTPTGSNFRIGGADNSAGGEQDWFGSMDECAYWRRFLSDGDLALIFNGGTTPLPFSSYN